MLLNKETKPNMPLNKETKPNQDYCLLDTTYFIYVDDNFIRVTSLHDRKLTVPNITE